MHRWGSTMGFCQMSSASAMVWYYPQTAFSPIIRVLRWTQEPANISLAVLDLWLRLLATSHVCNVSGEGLVVICVSNQDLLWKQLVCPEYVPQHVVYRHKRLCTA